MAIITEPTQLTIRKTIYSVNPESEIEANIGNLMGDGLFDDEAEAYEVASNDYWTEVFPEHLEAIEDIVGDDLILTGGSAGLWNGRRQYEVQYVGSLDDFFRKTTDGDLREMKLTQGEDGDLTLEVTISHHDGTNCYTLKPWGKMTRNSIVDVLNDLGIWSDRFEDKDTEYLRDILAEELGIY